MKKVNFNIPYKDNVHEHITKNYLNIYDYHIVSESLDARGAQRGKTPRLNYSILLFQSDEDKNNYFNSLKEEFLKPDNTNLKPIIVGAGPAGLFSALRFQEYGIKTIIIERGSNVHSRMLKISKFWKSGILDEDDNVCFGAGGAGLFSDGKLITRVKSPYVKYVMKKLIEFGADSRIEYVSNPHIGSNKIRKIITNLINFLIKEGHQIMFNTTVEDFIIDDPKSNNGYKNIKGVITSNHKEILSEHVILATGHSAKNIYKKLHEKNVDMKSKDFAMGVRIEHPRCIIDKSQHGDFSDKLDSARYSLKYYNKESLKGTYSFCMCPGGYVLSSGTEKNSIVTNGMSNSKRNSNWSNSAIVVEVNTLKDIKSDNVFSGLKAQQQIEKHAFDLSKTYADSKMLPAMTLSEFFSERINSKKLPVSSSPSKVFKTNVHEILPNYIKDNLKIALENFSKKISGYNFKDALIFAPETRTSSPITIIRGEDFQSTSTKGLYPCGEGAGYAGGITSAAVDGVKVTNSILSSILEN